MNLSIELLAALWQGDRGRGAGERVCYSICLYSARLLAVASQVRSLDAHDRVIDHVMLSMSVPEARGVVLS